jgi:hypothetical protein
MQIEDYASAIHSVLTVLWNLGTYNCVKCRLFQVFYGFFVETIIIISSIFFNSLASKNLLSKIVMCAISDKKWKQDINSGFI